MAKLGINGGSPVMVSFDEGWPIIGAQEKADIRQILELGRLGHVSQLLKDGERVYNEEFRNAFARYYGVDYAIGAPNGSIALELALRNAGIGPGDEVITPPTTWVATNIAPAMVGAKTVFVDVSPKNYCMDPARIEEAVTPRTKAIICVHLGGYPCEMDRIMQVADKHGLLVVEDCAQSHGSEYKGKLTGTWGHAGSFSFEISKLMTAGEGGMSITSDSRLGDAVHGFCGEAGAQFEKAFAKPRKSIGWNYRMTEMQAALLLGQLGRLDAQKQARMRSALYLNEELAKIDGIEPLEIHPGQNFFSYLFKYEKEPFKGASKRTFLRAMTEEGMLLFSSASHQAPAYRSGYFHSAVNGDCSRIRLPVAERAFEEEAIGFRGTGILLWDRERIARIVEIVRKIADNADELVRWERENV